MYHRSRTSRCPGAAGTQEGNKARCALETSTWYHVHTSAPPTLNNRKCVLATELKQPVSYVHTDTLPTPSLLLFLLLLLNLEGPGCLDLLLRLLLLLLCDRTLLVFLLHLLKDWRRPQPIISYNVWSQTSKLFFKNSAGKETWSEKKKKDTNGLQPQHSPYSSKLCRIKIGKAGAHGTSKQHERNLHSSLGPIYMSYAYAATPLLLVYISFTPNAS